MYEIEILAVIIVAAPIICLDFVSNYTQDSSLQIQLSDGVIQGKLKRTVNVGMPYYSYEGIPYAKPPVGELRFKSPQEPEKWEGVLDANGDVPSCIQIGATTLDSFESEDCLYINVYTPQAPSHETKADLAVMVWIYGGGFLFGVANSTYYGPDHLLHENVVVVHFNYRVNVFGFLSTGDLELPGNYGLKDQLLALKWVKNNIAKFGGDPDKITIFGESAGGASVQFHLISRKSEGLFARAISESGSTLCPWALQTNPLKIANLIGKGTGLLFYDSTKQLADHLRNLSTQKLKLAVNSIILLNSARISRGLPFSPTIEPEHDDAFLTRKSYEVLESGDFYKVPYISGFNSQESAMFQSPLELVQPIITLIPKSEILIPPGLIIKNRKEIEEVAGIIRDFYFRRSSDESTVDQWLNLISDSYFNRPIMQGARMYAKHAPIYLYKFSYEGYYLGKKAFTLGQLNKINGVMHSEEIWYIFERSDLKRVNESDKLIRRRIVKLWTNFAKYGDPTPSEDELLQNITWPQFNNDHDYPYLDIDLNLSIGLNYRREMLEFWEEVFEKYGSKPFDTY